MTILNKAVMLSCSAISSFSLWANEIQQESESEFNLSGNIGLTSKYISRGLTNSPENDDLAIQGGLTLNYNNFYASYWGSTLGYSYAALQGEPSRRIDKFEHDFILGYNFNTENLSGSLWNATYYYPGGTKTTSNEMGLTLSHQFNPKTSLSTQVSTYLYDVVYANQGDTYVSLGLNYEINEKLSSNTLISGNYFNDEGRYEGNELGDTQRNYAFRFASTGLSYLLSPELSVSAQYILGGYNRYDEKQRNATVFSMNYSF